MVTEPLSREALCAQLQTLGLAPGDGVFVHASLGAMGRVAGGAQTVVTALLDVVGPDGLIGMPGFSGDAYVPSAIDLDSLTRQQVKVIERAVGGHDPAGSDCASMGAIAEHFRTAPGTLRSAHPCISVCLSGPDAEDLIAPHPLDWASGPDTPLGRLASRERMKMLLIGVGWNRCSLLHTAEALAAHRRIKMRRFKTGPGDALWFQTPDVADDNDRLFPLVGQAFEATGAVQVGALGAAEARLCDYAALLRFATGWIDARNRADGVRRLVC